MARPSASRQPAPTAQDRPRRKRRPVLAGAAALRALGPLLKALATADAHAPVALARRLRRAISAALGWEAALVPSATGLCDEAPSAAQHGAVSVAVAPGAGALRLEGGSPAARRQVAALCALALARSRAHPREAVNPHEAPRRSGEAARPRVLLVAAPGRRRRALAALLEPGHEIALARDTATAARLARTGAVDAALVDLADGRAALAALARLRAAGLPDLGAVVVGLPGDGATRLRALELGAELATSPWTGPELLARLDRAIRLGRATRALRDQALTDPLTGLANRRALRARLAEELQRVRRYRTTLTCLMADIDRLKAINDDLGHAAGDQALQGAASALQAGLRETDFAARAGGDEFLVLLPHTSERQGAVLAERLRRRLRQVRVGPPGASRRLEASFGVAQLDARADGEAMIAAADRALYAAKQAGRATVRRAAAR